MSRETFSKGERVAVPTAESRVKESVAGFAAAAMSAVPVKGLSSSGGGLLVSCRCSGISFPSDFFVNLLYGVVFAIVSISGIAKIIKMAEK